MGLIKTLDAESITLIGNDLFYTPAEEGRKTQVARVIGAIPDNAIHHKANEAIALTEHDAQQQGSPYYKVEELFTGRFVMSPKLTATTFRLGGEFADSSMISYGDSLAGFIEKLNADDDRAIISTIAAFELIDGRTIATDVGQELLPSKYRID